MTYVNRHGYNNIAFMQGVQCDATVPPCKPKWYGRKSRSDKDLDQKTFLESAIRNRKIYSPQVSPKCANHSILYCKKRPPGPMVMPEQVEVAPKPKQHKDNTKTTIRNSLNKMAEMVMAVTKHIPLLLIWHIIVIIVVTSYLNLETSKPNGLMSRALIEIFINKETCLQDLKYTFLEIHYPDQVWTYLEDTFIKSLAYYHEEDLHLAEDNYLVGVPRMRMVAVHRDSCEIPVEFKDYFFECSAEFSPKNEMQDANEKGGYKSASQNGGASYVGYFATYPPSGYAKLLTNNKSLNAQLIPTFDVNGWFEGSARAFFVEFTLFNGHINAFAVMKLVFEQASTGLVRTSYSLNVVNLHRFLSGDGTSIFLMLFFILNLLVLLALLAFGFYQNRLLQLADFFTYIDLSLIVLSVMFLVYKSKLSSHSQRILNTGWDLNAYNNFDDIAQANESLIHVTALLHFLIWAKLLKYLTFTYTSSNFYMFLSKNTCLLFTILFMVFPFLCAFVLFGTFLFGNHVDNYSRLCNTAATLLRVTVFSFNYEEIYETNPEMAFIFLFLGFVILHCLTMGLYLGIMASEYYNISSLEKRPTDWTIGSFLFKIFHSGKKPLCYMSALRKEGFDISFIPYLLEKYNVEACDAVEPNVFKRICYEERGSFYSEGEEYYGLRREIDYLGDRVQYTEWTIQFLLVKVDQYIFKVELYCEGWAEVLNNMKGKKKKRK